MPIGDTKPEYHEPEDHDLRPPEQIALCLSGGGYRAMVFHLGALRRLNEAGYLHKLTSGGRVSSVSGGSITAAKLGLEWTSLTFDSEGVATNFEQLVVDPIIGVAQTSLDVGSFLEGLLTPGRSAGQELADNLNDLIFADRTLEHLPADDDGPRFVINATSLQTGKLFRFSRPFQGDWTIGLWRDPTTLISNAVAASAGFPPIFSPIDLSPTGTFDEATRGPNAGARYSSQHELADGGIYDNLGLETAWNSYRTILVSDGGGAFEPDANPPDDKLRHSVHIAKLLDHQVRSLRKRQVIAAYQSDDSVLGREGTYWSIRSHIDDYGLDDPLPFERTSRTWPWDVPTRLTALDDDVIADIANFGYAITDTAMRRWVL